MQNEKRTFLIKMGFIIALGTVFIMIQPETDYRKLIYLGTMWAVIGGIMAGALWLDAQRKKKNKLSMF